MAFFSPEIEGMEDQLYHITQSKITVGSGEIWGVGIGESGQRYGWLPEIQSDSIFAAAGEELGFIRMIILVGAFVLIAWRGFHIAEHSNDRFSKLLATGITAWISFQALINMAVTLDLMPLTGITLPFISYGGSSLFSLMFASGILIHISMNQTESKYFYKRAKVKRGAYKRR
jgi:cell division protein FtsW